MPITPIYPWSLSSPDTTVWVPSISTSGVVSVTSGGGVITATPPVYQGTPESVIWTPSISNGGIVSHTSGAAAGQYWATLKDTNLVRWYFSVDVNGIVTVAPLTGFTMDEVALYSTALSLTRIQAHYAARLNLDYPFEVLTDTPVGYWRLGDNGSALSYLDGWSQRPITIEVNGVSWREQTLVNSLSIDDTLGQQMTADFTLVNPTEAPVVGDQVRLLYYSLVLFAGTVESVSIQVNNTGTATYYALRCTDWMQILIRRKIRRNFTNLTVSDLMDSLIDNELAGEGLSIGTIDNNATLPLVESRNARAADLMRDVAGITGQSIYVDFDKVIHLQSTSNPAGLPLTVNNVETATIDTNRETYRNVQYVTAKGTPPAESDEDAVSSTQIRQNDEQIAARAAREGGTGIYDEMEEITHPTSNDAADVALLGIGYARLRLATSGSLKATVKARVRRYAFRAGQFIDMTLPSMQASGTWLIQRCSITEEDGRKLIHELELTQSSLQQRAYESWLRIVEQGKVTIQMPGSLTNNLQTYDTPGSYIFTVPAGITSVEVTTYGGSGGGGGAARYTGITYGEVIDNGFGYYAQTTMSRNGGNGGASGRATTTISVVEGETLTIVVGAAGVNGNSTSLAYHTLPLTNPNTSETSRGATGGTGQRSQVLAHGAVVCQADGGLPGTGGYLTITRFTAGSGHGMANHSRIYYWHGTDGQNSASGIGDAVSVGGGFTGGVKGLGSPYGNPPPAHDGRVEVRW